MIPLRPALMLLGGALAWILVHQNRPGPFDQKLIDLFEAQK